MLATASAQVCVPLGHSSLYLSNNLFFVDLAFRLCRLIIYQVLRGQPSTEVENRMRLRLY